MKDAALIIFLFFLVCLTTVIVSDRYINFDKIDSFPLAGNCEASKLIDMKIWITEIHAICPKEKELRVYVGPQAIGKDKPEAQRYLDQNGLGYCKIIGELKETVIYPQKEMEKRN